jgi:hypothetical protein
MGLASFLSLRQMQAPIIVYFEHLDSEYRALKSKITAPEDINTIDLLDEKRKSDDFSWNDLYTFELILANYRPVEQLRSKVIQLRNDYRSVAGQREFDEYMASKPPNLMEPPDPTDPPDASKAEFEKLLREDIKDVLGRLFVQYEILPVKEAKLKGLTWWAAGLCLTFLLLLFISVLALFLTDRPSGGGWRIPSLTIFVVAIAGAMGGIVSAIQRIQKPLVGGDSFYNLARLFYASYSIFIAPITGAIFGILLYLMFTAGILKGAFFPNIYTPPATYQETGAAQRTGAGAGAAANTSAPPERPASQTGTTGAPPPTNIPTQQNTARPLANSTNTTGRASTTPVVNPNSATNTSNTQGTAGTQTPGNTTSNTAAENTSRSQAQSGVTGNVNAATTAPSPSPTPMPVATKSIGVKDFLAQSGPAGGEDYAMLILWCFIAGFAERLVPDALDRLIAQKDVEAGKSK